jgi:hypothetical protein
MPTGRCQARAAVPSIAPVIQASGMSSRFSAAPPQVAAAAVVHWMPGGRGAAARWQCLAPPRARSSNLASLDAPLHVD